MATLAATLPRVRSGHSFYLALAAAFVVLAFGGFAPSYWAKVVSGTYHGAPIYHLHGAVLFTWTLYYFTQTALVAAGRTVDHRRWGMLGIALATAIGFTVVMTAMTSIRVDASHGFGDQTRRFEAVAFVGLLVFGGFFTAAIASVRKPQWHKRWMILAMIPLVQAAAGRLVGLLMAPPGPAPVDGPAPPVFVTIVPGLVVDMLIVAAMIYDWRTRGRVHPAYIVGLPLLIVSQFAVVPIAASAAWMRAAHGLETLMG